MVVPLDVTDIPNLVPGTILSVSDPRMLNPTDKYLVVSNDNFEDGVQYLRVNQYNKDGKPLSKDIVMCKSVKYCCLCKGDELFLFKMLIGVDMTI